MPDGVKTPTQAMIENLRWLRSRGASVDEQRAEMERWKPKIAAQNQREMSQAGTGVAGQFLRGMTSEFSDELAGLGSGIAAMVPGGQSPTDAYKAERDAVRMTNDAYARENPGRAIAAQLAGGIGQGVVTAGGASALGAGARLVPVAARLGKAGTSAALGAGAGAVTGLGGADTMADVPRAAGIGAVGGGIGGALLSGAGSLLGAVGRRTGITAPRNAETGGAVSRAVKGALQKAGVQDVDDAAVQRVVAEMEKSGRSLDDILAGSPFDPTSVLGDVNIGGQKAARLMGTARRLGDTAPELAEDVLRGRSMGRPVKMMGDLEGITGQGRVNVADEMDDLIREARDAARPLYDQLRQFPAVRDPRVNEAIALIPEGRFRAIWQSARNIARDEGRDLTRDIVDEGGTLRFDLEPAEMDALKKGLDEVIYSGAAQARMNAPGGMANSEVNLLKKARRLLVGAADDATGGPGGVYAQARRAYAGPVAIREALEAGEGLPTMNEAAVERAVRGLSDAEGRAFRRGGTEAMRERLAKIPEGATNVPRRYLSEQARAQSRAALGEQGAREWEEAARGELAREATEGMVLRGSPTAERLADDEVAQLGTALAQRGPTGVAGQLVGEALRRGERALWLGSTAAEMDAVMRLLTTNVGTQKARQEVLALLKAGKTARAEVVARAALRNAGVAGRAGAVGAEP